MAAPRASGKASDWPRAIVFDLDGTLVDSAPDIAASLNAGFAPLGVAPFTVEVAKSMIGGGARVAIERASRHLGLTLSASDNAGIYERFMQTYARVSAEGKGLYPGVHELLRGLRAEGRPLALCTNKALPITHITLQALDIAGYFDVVIGAEDGKPRKPDPDPVRRALAPFGVVAADAVMIGDSHADIDAGRAAGVHTIAVTYGYSAKPVAELGADALADHLGAVPAVLARLRSRVPG